MPLKGLAEEGQGTTVGGGSPWPVCVALKSEPKALNWRAFAPGRSSSCVLVLPWFHGNACSVPLLVWCVSLCSRAKVGLYYSVLSMLAPFWKIDH